MNLVKKVYTRNGITVRRREEQRLDRMEIYDVIFPPEKWWPSKWASFTFKEEKNISPEYYMSLLPDVYNASLWQNKRNTCYTLRVPKDRGNETRKILYRKGYWFHTGIYLWCRRTRMRSQQSYPSAVRLGNAVKK